MCCVIDPANDTFSVRTIGSKKEYPLELSQSYEALISAMYRRQGVILPEHWRAATSGVRNQFFVRACAKKSQKVAIAILRRSDLLELEDDYAAGNRMVVNGTLLSSG